MHLEYEGCAIEPGIQQFSGILAENEGIQQVSFMQNVWDEVRSSIVCNKQQCMSASGVCGLITSYICRILVSGVD